MSKLRMLGPSNDAVRRESTDVKSSVARLESDLYRHVSRSRNRT